MAIKRLLTLFEIVERGGKSSIEYPPKLPRIVNIHIGTDANSMAIKKLNINILLRRNDIKRPREAKRNDPLRPIPNSSLRDSGKLLSSINLLLQSSTSISDKRK